MSNLRDIKRNKNAEIITIFETAPIFLLLERRSNETEFAEEYCWAKPLEVSLGLTSTVVL